MGNFMIIIINYCLYDMSGIDSADFIHFLKESLHLF